jgi:DNA-binding MarR family transcriptional regulator
MADKEWYTQQEIADITGVNLDKVRAAVAALDNAGAIRTSRDPNDRRYIIVHESSLETVKRAVLGSAR